jgi:hypothetical protein
MLNDIILLTAYLFVKYLIHTAVMQMFVKKCKKLSISVQRFSVYARLYHANGIMKCKNNCITFA